MRDKYLVFLFMVVFVESASPRKRTVRHVSCQENQEYKHENHCCLNCPAGEYVKEQCTAHLARGTCEPCPHETFTEHGNGLTQCLPCKKCHIDEDMIKSCTSTQNTECQCKPGLFCVPDQACEVCKKCSKCKLDEEEVKNCTSISNTVCKMKSSSFTVSGVIASVIVLCIFVTLVICFICWRKGVFNKETEISCKTSEIFKSNMGADEMDPFQPDPLQGGVQYRRLTPLDEQESLKRCLDLFGELDSSYHKRFFRRIGLSDNKIQSVDHLPHADRVYDLLRIWMEKEGLKADINHLLEVLLSLDQKLTAENITDKAIKNGDFMYEDD
ncbi:hematopoietic death receptor isoform X2 [Paramormyrops kingsleyae]|uniref:hematopoietic death receptor isoform X2 n=1 Tax=Paramormyrops kingsleyae TaxID=1676925 RepID=UPI000CD61CD5|nr:tumor necrosis factor receptor superfamily member 10B-like isoform X2 [Paramormyrops kingsleyae]